MLPIIMATALGASEDTVTALGQGANDYVTKPLILEELLRKIRRLIDFRAQQMEIQWYRHQLQAEYDFANIVGNSERMKETYHLVERVAATDSPVLITGESGTGKELIAGAIHHNGPRKDRRFIPLNCAAIPAALLESQMFGHVKGSFTGATSSKQGLFRHADSGTLFLDEIGNVPLTAQYHLLRALQEGSIRPVGSHDEIEVDVRVVAATSVSLEDEVEKGRFREDLYYRLDVIRLEVPPLRDREEDIPPLAMHFLEHVSKDLGRDTPTISHGQLESLKRHSWPGNIRELKNVIERAVILTKGSRLRLDMALQTESADATEGIDSTNPAAGNHSASGSATTGVLPDYLTEVEFGLSSECYFRMARG